MMEKTDIKNIKRLLEQNISYKEIARLSDFSEIIVAVQL